MSASIWAPGGELLVNSNNRIAVEHFIVSDINQSTFTLTNFTYVLGTNSISVYLNGVMQRSGIDYSESSGSTITFLSHTFVVGDVVSTVGQIAVTSGSANPFGTSIQSFIATAGQTVFPVTHINYTPNNGSLRVYINGLLQEAGDSYQEIGGSIVFSEGLEVGDEVLASFNSEIGLGQEAAYVSYMPAGTAAVATDVQSKLREFVSVKDFGAKGDGITDDTAAIQAAVSTLGASGTAVYFPPGVYIVGSTIMLPTGSNLYADVQSAVIKQKNGANLDALLQSGVAGSSQTTVRMLGLRIDGNRANQTSGAGHVIRFYRPLYTWIDQCEVINARGDNIQLNPESGDFENYIRNCRTYNAGRNNVRIEGNGTDCHIRGGNHGYSVASCITLSSASSSINDATIWGGNLSTYGIELYGVSCQIRNNEIEGNKNDGIYVGNTALHSFIEGNKIYANSFSPGTSGLYGGVFVAASAGPGTFVANRVYASISDTAPYNHLYSLKFAGAHGVWELSGNSMIYTGASNAGIEATSGVVVGLLYTDKCDALWSKSFVQIGLSADLTTPALGGWTILPFNAEAADTWSEWDSVNYKFKPKESGYYQISGIIFVAPDAAGNQMGFRLASNVGTEIARLGYQSAVDTNFTGVQLRALRVFLTEGTLYQFQYFLQGATTKILANSAYTAIQIVRVPQ